MKKLFDLANKIKDRKLRKLVIDFLKNPHLSNKNFKYRPSDFSKAPASIGFHHVYEGGLLQHTEAVTRMSIALAEALQEVYKISIDMDALIAAAVLHDIAKIWCMQKNKEWKATDITLDHTMLGTAELYARGFPEKVIHIVASHFGSSGPTPPQTIEAAILHTVDSLDAALFTQKTEDKLLQLLLGQ